MIPAAVLLSACAVPAQDPGDPLLGSSAFRVALDEASWALEEARWEDARAALLQLVEEFRDAPAMHARLPEIHEDLLRCAFELSGDAGVPAIGASWDAETLAWDAGKRDLELRFGKPFRAFPRGDDRIFLPAGLGSPGKLVLYGEGFGSAGDPRITLGGGGAVYEIDLAVDTGGGVQRASVLRGSPDGARWESLDRDDKLKLAKGEPWRIEITLKRSNLQLKFHRKVLLKGKLSPEPAPRIALENFDLDDLTIEWEGELDEDAARRHALAAWRQQLAAFRATPAAQDLLPEHARALLDGMSLPRGGSAVPGMAGASKTTEERHAAFLAKIAEDLDGIDYAALFLGALQGDAAELPAATRSYYLALAAMEAGLPDRATPLADDAAEQSRYHPEAVRLQVEMALREGDDEHALQALATAQQARPADGGLWLMGLRWLLRCAAPETVEQYFATADKEYPQLRPAIDRGRYLTSRAKGPPAAWGEAHRFASPQVLVVTDVSQEFADMVGGHAVAAVATLGKLVPWLKSDQPLRLYVFASEAACRRWAEGAGESPEQGLWCREYRAGVMHADVRDPRQAVERVCVEALLWECFPTPPLALRLGLPEVLRDSDFVPDLPQGSLHRDRNLECFRLDREALPFPEGLLAREMRWVDEQRVPVLVARSWLMCRIIARRDTRFAEWLTTFQKAVRGGTDPGEAILEVLAKAAGDEMEKSYKEFSKELDDLKK